MEFVKDEVGVDYLYEVFMRGAELPVDLKSYHKSTFAKRAGQGGVVETRGGHRVGRRGEQGKAEDI
jgi:hypothetical protein